jgi:hypothetical protein
VANDDEARCVRSASAISSSSQLLFIAVRRFVVLGNFEFAEEIEHAVAAFGGDVEFEVQLRRELQDDPLRERVLELPRAPWRMFIDCRCSSSVPMMLTKTCACLRSGVTSTC